MLTDTSLDLSLPSERAAAGVPAPEHLHARCARAIERHIQRTIGTDDEVDDLVQEILVTIFTKIGTLRDPALFDAWVAQVTKNKVRHVVRQRSVRRRVLATWQENHDSTFRADLDGRLTASRALDVLERLSPKERALLTALWFTPGNVNDIAARWGCSVSTLRRRLGRAQTRFEKLARRDASLARCYERSPRSP